MPALHALVSGPQHYRGEGVNHEGERFLGELRVEVLEAGRAVLLLYTASLIDGTVVHTESTLLATGPDGRQCLWPVMSELPAVLPHTEIRAEAVSGTKLRAVFSTGPKDDLSVFREEIAIEFKEDGGLVYAHAWGLPEGNFEERSSCSLLPCGA